MGFMTKALGTLGHQGLSGLVRNRSKSATIARATGGTMTGVYGYSIGEMDVDQSSQAYERVSMVYRCVDAIAKAQSKVPIVLRDGGPDGVEVEDDDFHRLMNIRWNEDETALAARYRLSGQLLLSRRGAFIEKVRGPLGTVKALRLLPPGDTEPIKCSEHFIDGYKVRGANFTEYELKPQDVIWIKIAPHPFDPYSQMTPLVAARLAVDTDWLARMFNRNFLLNDGRPGLMVAIKGALNPEDAAEIKRRFSGGYAQAGRTSVFEADGIDVQDMAASPRDVQWMEAVKGSDEDIRLAFGVAESVLGNASGRTFANADAEMEGFYKITVTDHCLPIANAFDELTSSNGDSVSPYFDWSKVEELQRAINMKRQKATEDYDGGRITLDEWRVANGYTTFDHPLSRVVIHKFGVVGCGTDEDIAKVAELPNITQPKQPELEPASDTSYSVEQIPAGQGDPPELEAAPVDYQASLLAILGAIQQKNSGVMRPKVIRGQIES